MQTQEQTTETAPCFQLKGGLFTLTAVQLLDLDFELLKVQLVEKIKQAPKFFNHAPVVIDCQKVNQEDVKIDFKTLKDILCQARLIPVGVRHANKQQQTIAVLAGLAVLSESLSASPANKEEVIDLKSITQQQRAPEQAAPEEKPSKDDLEGPATRTRLITTPVRSGQQLFVPGGDLIITAPVSHGAELLAEGHIHVYAPLRGRALAGVTGDTSARIFCSCLEAELVSIAGRYLPSEALRDKYWKQPVCISLKGEALQIAPL